MQTELKQIGGSKVIILPTLFLKVMGLKVGDILDISDVVK